MVKPINEVNSKLTELKKLNAVTDVVEQLIKERMKQLLVEAVKYLAKVNTIQKWIKKHTIISKHCAITRKY